MAYFMGRFNNEIVYEKCVCPLQILETITH